MDDPIATSFSPLITLPCWGVDKVQGSTLSLEFGEPRLVIREPSISRSESPAVRAKMARRNVKPVGAWNLWIANCHWQLLSRGNAIANDEADDEAIKAAARELDGQRLMGVTLDTPQRSTTFCFDLGGTLATWPVEFNHEEQWWLYMPDNWVLSYRADGRYSFGASIQKPGEEVWQVLPPEPRAYCVGSPIKSPRPG